MVEDQANAMSILVFLLHIHRGNQTGSPTNELDEGPEEGWCRKKARGGLFIFFVFFELYSCFFHIASARQKYFSYFSCSTMTSGF